MEENCELRKIERKVELAKRLKKMENNRPWVERELFSVERIWRTCFLIFRGNEVCGEVLAEK